MDRITKSFLEEFCKINELANIKESKQYEYFSNYCAITKEYGNSSFDLDDMTTGEATQGIDGIGIIVNNKLVNEVEEIKDLIEINKVLNVKFVLIQSKTSSSFSNPDILNFFAWTESFFLGEKEAFSSEEMKKFLELKEFIYDTENCKYMSKANPILEMYYTTTGNWVNDKNLQIIVENNKNKLKSCNLFSKIDFTPVGASEIQDLYRKTKEKSFATFNFGKRVTIPTDGKIKEGYYGIISFEEYRKIIIDDKDNMKNVFEDNIRDFLGEDNDVNESMNETLNDVNSIMKFGLLNNGITIVTEDISVTGDCVSVTNYQIVNGCQTSHILYQNRELPEINKVYIPIRIIATDDDEIKNEITTATNNQTAIKKEQLAALSDYQRNLEQYYNTYPDNGFKLYYERRTNQYNQMPVPKNKIVSISTQIKAFSSMFLDMPHAVTGFYGTVVRKSEGEIFKRTDKFIMYYASALTLYKLEYYFKNGTLDSKYRRAKNHILMLFKLVVFNNEIPNFNSAEMERKCQKMIDYLVNNDTRIFNDIIDMIKNNPEKLDILDRKLFERKETTDQLVALIGPIIEMYNSEKSNSINALDQISFF
ncbi:MAG: AIPR family protein [Clostridia bacterium]